MEATGNTLCQEQTIRKEDQEGFTPLPEQPKWGYLSDEPESSLEPPKPQPVPTKSEDQTEPDFTLGSEVLSDEELAREIFS